jgi:hypothetical protein
MEQQTRPCSVFAHAWYSISSIVPRSPWRRRAVKGRYPRPILQRFSCLPTAIPMSSVNQPTDLSISNFTNIFDAASNEYKKLTKHDLRTHPFAAALGDCDSPEAILNVFRTQEQAFDRFCKGDDRLMKWLDPIVHILFTLSATLGEGIALVSV